LRSTFPTDSAGILLIRPWLVPVKAKLPLVVSAALAHAALSSAKCGPESNRWNGGPSRPCSWAGAIERGRDSR
jgi:hypothetical protein